MVSIFAVGGNGDNGGVGCRIPLSLIQVPLLLQLDELISCESISSVSWLNVDDSPAGGMHRDWLRGSSAPPLVYIVGALSPSLWGADPVHVLLIDHVSLE